MIGHRRQSFFTTLSLFCFVLDTLLVYSIPCSFDWQFYSSLYYYFQSRNTATPACMRQKSSFEHLSSADGIRTTIPVGEECVININTADAGYGNITCHIRSTSGSDVDIDVVDNADGTVSILYTPRLPGAYTLNIKFGGQTVPNGDFIQQVCRRGLCKYFRFYQGISCLLLKPSGGKRVVIVISSSEDRQSVSVNAVLFVISRSEETAGKKGCFLKQNNPSAATGVERSTSTNPFI